MTGETLGITGLGLQKGCQPSFGGRPHGRSSAQPSPFLIEPPLVANLSGNSRELRRPIPFSELPPVLLNAVLSAEDKRFFHHFGFDTLRLIKSVFVNMKSGEKARGGVPSARRVPTSERSGA